MIFAAQCDRALQLRSNLFDAAERAKRKSHIVVIFGSPIIDGDGLANQVGGRNGIASLQGEQTKTVHAVGVIGIKRKYAALSCAQPRRMRQSGVAPPPRRSRSATVPGAGAPRARNARRCSRFMAAVGASMNAVDGANEAIRSGQRRRFDAEVAEAYHVAIRSRRGGRVAEGGGLQTVMVKPYHGFRSILSATHAGELRVAGHLR